MSASEDGWEPAQVGVDALEWATVPGTNVTLQLMKGEPLLIMRAYAADYNAYVESLRDADSAGWTPTNSVATSNHLNGTAMDLNWDDHAFQVSYAGYDDAKIATMRDLLTFYEGTMFWAQDWDTPKDCMHHQMGYDTYQNAHTQDFINRKIRSDGFSTFRRSETPPPPPPPPPLSKADQYALAIIHEGQKREVTPRGIQIALATALVESNITMYANSNDPASLQLPHDAVGSDHMSTGIFQQQNFAPWGTLECRMDAACSAGLFYAQLVKLDYNNPANSPGSYAQDVQGSAYPDRYDERFSEAVDLYNRLVSAAPPVPPQEEGVFMALTAEQQQQIYEKITAIWDSRSPFRHLGEHARDDTVGFLLNTDSNAHVPTVITLAMLGDPGSVALLEEIAGADPAKYPDRQTDAALAKRVLAALQSATTPGGTTPPVVVVGPPVVNPPPAPSPHKITLLTISGHMADMWTGYPSDLARAMDPKIFYHQPVGSWDFNSLPLGPPCDVGYKEGVRLLREVHPTGPWAIACYSQGAIIGSRLYMALAPGGELADRAQDFVGGVTFGNPYREQGSCVGRDPGGHGISSTRIVGTGPMWHDYVDPGDLYANVSGPSGDDCTAIYDLIMRVNPLALMGEALKLFTNPAPELIAMVQAIIQGITFAASNPATAAHISYQWREVEPGITYFDHAVNTMRAIGAQART